MTDVSTFCKFIFVVYAHEHEHELPVKMCSKNVYYETSSKIQTEIETVNKPVIMDKNAPDAYTVWSTNALGKAPWRK